MSEVDNFLYKPTEPYPPLAIGKINLNLDVLMISFSSSLFSLGALITLILILLDDILSSLNFTLNFFFYLYFLYLLLSYLLINYFYYYLQIDPH